MDDARIGRTILALRQRRGWRQVDLAARAGVSQSAISDMERGRLERYTLATVRGVLRSLDASAALDIMWGGRGDLDRLLDADHAALVTKWAELHTSAGWVTWPEASYSIYGERGRIDLLAYHPGHAVLEVVEAKTGLWDLQDTLGRLDAKVRLAPQVAAERGWRPSRVVGCLLLAGGRTTRRRLGQHRQLFAAYDVRGRSAIAFVRDPRRPAKGLLALVDVGARASSRKSGQRRVRATRPGALTAAVAGTAPATGAGS